MNHKLIKHKDFKQNSQISIIKKVLSELKESKDIEGALLVEGTESVLASALPNRTEHEMDVTKILAQMRELQGHINDTNDHGMFSQHIFEYNGFTVLARTLNNLTLLVMLQKSGYMGLAMLDIENSIRKIDQVLRRTGLKTAPSPLLNLTSIFFLTYPGNIGSPNTHYGEKDEYG